jgi:hypothetical protein
MTAVHSEQLAGARFTRRAWWSLLGFVPSFALAFLIGEGLISALGYPTGGEELAPWWAALIAVTPALIVFVLPAVAAIHFGRRAMRLGDVSGRLPIVVSLVVTSVFVLLNGVSALTIWLF